MFSFSMTRERIVESISNLRNGTMARITYVTELPLKSEFAKKGYRILKVVETTGRFGVNYSNIKSVIEKKSDPNYKHVEKENNFEWIVKNKISHNTKTGKDYIRFAPMKKGANKHSNMIFVDTEGKHFSFDSNDLPEDFQKMVVNSYWSKKHEAPAVQTICLDNVIMIKSKSIKK